MSHSISFTFYTRSAVYKNQGDPDRCPVLSLILFTCIVSRIKSKLLPIDVSFYLLYFIHVLRTKSKGLPIDVPFYLLYFLHVQRRIQKVRGSRSTSHSIFYTFDTRSTIISRSTFNVLFIHNNHRRMKSMGHLYTYIHHRGTQQNHFQTSL
jgi:hypothetical protein